MPRNLKGGAETKFTPQGIYGTESQPMSLKSLPTLPLSHTPPKATTPDKGMTGGATKPKAKPPVKNPKPHSKPVKERAKGPIANQLFSLMRGSKTPVMRGGAGTFDARVAMNMEHVMTTKDPYNISVTPNARYYQSHLDPVTSVNTTFDNGALLNMGLVGGGKKKPQKKNDKKKTQSKK